MRAASPGCCTRPPAWARRWRRGWSARRSVRTGRADAPPPLTLLWITPLRALAADTGLALTSRSALRCARTGPSTCAPATPAAGARAAERAAADGSRHHAGEPHAVPCARRLARALCGSRGVVVDEWHELLSSKRGVQTELALARLRGARPGLRTWALSATLAQSRRRARMPRRRSARDAARIVRGARHQDHRHRQRAAADHRALSVGRPPRPQAAARRRRARSIARAQRSCSPTCARRPRSGTRRSSARVPTGRARIALHHGSLEREVRDWVEACAARRAAARCRLHVEPRSRRRLRAGRPGAADRQPERRRAAAAARGPQRPSSGRNLARHGRADASARAYRGRRCARAAAARGASKAGCRSVHRRTSSPAPRHRARWAADSCRKRCATKCGARARTRR